MTYITIIFFILTFFYVVMTLCFHISWRKIKAPDTLSSAKLFFSIIVPVRNESSNIRNLIMSINAQDYDGEFEAIIIDDNSEDNTTEIVNTLKQDVKFPLHVYPMALEKGFTGSYKKKALSLGISLSRGDYIITIDGDCTVLPKWLSSLAVFISNTNAKLVSGPVTFRDENTFFKKLQTIEFSSLIGSGAASLNMGYPTMCNGANLAFEKQAFEDVGGYTGSEHIPSGDDEFILLKIHSQYPGKVFFLKNKDFTVSTLPSESFKEFFYQRRRWAGKWRLHKEPKKILLAVFIFSYHLFFITSFIMTLSGVLSLNLFLIPALIKLTVEFVFLNSVLKFLGKHLNVGYFLVVEFVYSFYVVFFGLLANAGHFEWKGRRYVDSTINE